MNIEQLEKLAELLKKGVITQEEYDTKKKEMLDGTNDEKSSSFSWKTVFKISGISVVVIILLISLFSSEIKFACDEASMKQAQNLLNNHFPNWNNSMRLSNPTTVKQSENYLRCKADSNFREFAVIHYNLERQANGEILITSNPVGDAISQSTEEMINSISNWF